MPSSHGKEDQFGYYYGNVQGNIFAIDCLGKYGILGGQRTLFLINLDDCFDEKSLVPLKCDSKTIHDALWSPQDPHSFITATNEVVELWERKVDGRFEMKSFFHGHTRPICNLDWSPVCETHVATCSMDCFTYVLDTRDFKKASLTLQSTLPPSCVKWNKVSELVLATSHEGGVEIWDLRNVRQARPSALIAAHSRQINDFDWSPNIENQMITCSMDSSVKVWNVRKPKEDKDAALNLSRIVTCAKYTPFGNAMVTQHVPQDSDADLYLWKLKDASTPQHETVHYFPNSVKLTDWSFRKTGKDYQLVAWSTEQILKFWKIDPYLKKLCDSNLSSESYIAGKFSSMNEGANKHPETLSQEFELLSDSIPCIDIEMKNVSQRLMKVNAKVKKEVVKIEMTFPPSYPNLIGPNFVYLCGTTLDMKLQGKLLEELKNTARICVQYNRCCIEPCLRVLISFLEDVVKQEPDQVSEVQEFTKERLQGENVPFPRTSGARFSGPGYLVCFTRRMWMDIDDFASPTVEQEQSSKKKVAAEGIEVTPRAMSALAEIGIMPRKPTNFVNLAKSFQTDSYIPSISLFFAIKDKAPEQRVKSRSKNSRSAKASPKKTLGPVIIYDLSCLLPIQKQLGENYIFDDNPFEMCQKNAQVALSCGRKDLYQVWSLVSHQVANSSGIEPGSENSHPLLRTPFGKNLIKNWYEHYSSVRDVQTLAMMCCVFSHLKEAAKKEPLPVEPARQRASLVPTHKPNAQKSRRKHSHSFSEVVSDAERSSLISPRDSSNSCDTKMLEAMLNVRCNSFIKSYSNILYQWGFVNKRAELLNFLTMTSEDYIDTVVASKDSETCSVCHMPVRGPYVLCFECGHGGHVSHLSEWFARHDVCPSGCGCVCIGDSPASP